MKKELRRLKNKRKALLKEFISTEDWITGSIIQSMRTQSNRKAPFNYLSRSIGGKTKTTYIAGNKLNLFRDALDNGKECGNYSMK